MLSGCQDIVSCKRGHEDMGFGAKMELSTRKLKLGFCKVDLWGPRWPCLAPRSYKMLSALCRHLCWALRSPCTRLSFVGGQGGPSSPVQPGLQPPALCWGHYSESDGAGGTQGRLKGDCGLGPGLRVLLRVAWHPCTWAPRLPPSLLSQRHCLYRPGMCMRRPSAP